MYLESGYAKSAPKERFTLPISWREESRTKRMASALDNWLKFHYNGKVIGVWRSLVSRLVRVQEASGSNPDTPTKKLESAFAGSSFLIGVMGFERPLRKHAGGMFLGRGRIHRFLNAPGTGVGRKRSWSQYCTMVETSIVSKRDNPTFFERRRSDFFFTNFSFYRLLKRGQLITDLSLRIEG